jgi:hypothetical protein
MISKRDRVEALINKALDAATGEQEARNCAMAAVRLIREHKMLDGEGEPVYVVAASARVAATAAPVERPSGEYGPPGTNPRNANGHRIGCPCERCDSLPSDEKRTRWQHAADDIDARLRNDASQRAPKPRRRSSIHQRCGRCGSYCFEGETHCAVCGHELEAL